jgi:hypothetical protein
MYFQVTIWEEILFRGCALSGGWYQYKFRPIFAEQNSAPPYITTPQLPRRYHILLPTLRNALSRQYWVISKEKDDHHYSSSC